MKIVHVCLCGTFGEDYAYQDNLLPRYHKVLGHAVTVIAPIYCKINTRTGEEEMATPGCKILKDGVKLIRLAPLLRNKINIRLHLVKGLYSTLCLESPDLLFVHGIDSLSYYECVRYCKKHKSTKLVFDNHADWHNSYHNRIALLWGKYIIRNVIVKPALKMVRVFYGVTPARCSFLQEMYSIPQNLIDLLPFGADDNELNIEHRQELRNNVRETYNISNDDFLVVTGGKIDKRKNIHILARAVDNLTNLKVKLLIFGEINDEMKPYFDQIKSDRIITIGWVPSSDVYRYFYAAEFVVFTGLHSVLWEQMLASKVPCAITRIKGFEHVNFNDNCILLDNCSEENLSAIISNVYNDQELYSGLKRGADSDKANQFRYSSIAQKVIDDCIK